MGIPLILSRIVQWLREREMMQRAVGSAAQSEGSLKLRRPPETAAGSTLLSKARSCEENHSVKNARLSSHAAEEVL